MWPFLSSTNLETAASAFRCSDSTFKIPSRSCAVEILCLFFREIDLSLLFFIILNKIIICKPKSSPATLRSIRYDFFKGSKKTTLYSLFEKDTVYKKVTLNQGRAMGLGSHGIFVPGLGTDYLETLWTGTNIASRVPGQKSLGQPNFKLWGHLGL